MSSKDFLREVARQTVDELYPHFDSGEKGRVMRTLVRSMESKLAVMTADIREFHEKFDLAYNGEPRTLDRELFKFRHGFMEEELDEYRVGYEEDNREKQLDAIVDLVYVAIGTAYIQGFPFAKAWQRVHKANMAKVRATDASQSKRGSTSDVVKPEGWTAPDLSDLV